MASGEKKFGLAKLVKIAKKNVSKAIQSISPFRQAEERDVSFSVRQNHLFTYHPFLALVSCADSPVAAAAATHQDYQLWMGQKACHLKWAFGTQRSTANTFQALRYQGQARYEQDIFKLKQNLVLEP